MSASLASAIAARLRERAEMHRKWVDEGSQERELRAVAALVEAVCPAESMHVDAKHRLIDAAIRDLAVALGVETGGKERT